MRSQSATPSECPAPAAAEGGCVVSGGVAFWAPALREKKSRDDAEADCKSRGFDGLAVFRNLKQLGELASLASADGSWVRLNDKGGEGSFQPASDFSECDLSKPQAVGQATRCDQLWGFGEPNDYEDGEDCVFVDPRSTYNNLNDQGCEKLHHWVCVGTPPQDDPQALCDGGAQVTSASDADGSVIGAAIGGAIGGVILLAGLFVVLRFTVCAKKGPGRSQGQQPPPRSAAAAAAAVPMGQVHQGHPVQGYPAAGAVPRTAQGLYPPPMAMGQAIA